MDLTIKEIADQLEVSKNTVKYHMRKLDDELSKAELTYKNGGMIYVRPEGIAMIQESVQQVRADEPEVVNDEKSQDQKESEPAKTEGTENTAGLNAHIKDLQHQLAVLEKDKALKDEQLRTKDQQISELHQLLDQQQKLNLLAEAKIRALEGKTEGSLPELLEEDSEKAEQQPKTEDKPEPKADAKTTEKPQKETIAGPSLLPPKKWWQFWK